MMESEPDKKLKDANQSNQENDKNGHEIEEQIPYVGLRNQGNTCYMNSYLQTLYHLGDFTRLVLQIPTHGEPLVFPDSMQILFNGLLKESRAQSTVELCKSFGWDREDAFNQQDVQEFSCNIIEALERKVDKYEKLKGSIQNLFQGVAKNYIRCKNVEFCSERKETFFDIQLQVKGKKDIYESLMEYTSEELMTGDNQYDTEDPKFGRQDAIKGIKFQSLPPILQITLKRFDFDYQKMRLVKILDKYNYPLELNLYDFMDNSAKENDLSKENCLYTLYAVLIHSGKQSGSGHYYVYINKLNKWYKFNDSRVDIISEEEVLTGGEGGEFTEKKYIQQTEKIEETTIQKKETAYMLVYVQKNKANQILKDITDADIPQQIKTIYLEKKKREEAERRNREYFQVKLLTFQDLQQTNGNSLFFHKNHKNEYVSTENFDHIGKNISLKNMITLDYFLKQLANQLKCNEKDILLFKITYGVQLEKVANLSHLLQLNMGNFKVKQIFQSKIFSCQDYALLVLALNPNRLNLSLENITDEYQNEEDDDNVMAKQSIEITIDAEEKQTKDELLKQQKLVIFYKLIHIADKPGQLLLDSNNSLQIKLTNYIYVRVWDNFELAVQKIAKQQNISESKLCQNFEFYQEKNHLAYPLDINDIYNKKVYEVLHNRYYGVLVLKDTNLDKLSNEKIDIEDIYKQKENTYRVTFDPTESSCLIQEKKSYELKGEYTFDMVQRSINEDYYNDEKDYQKIYFQYYDQDKKRWVDFAIDENTLISDLNDICELRFGYDENMKAYDRSTCVNYKFYLMDHSQQVYLINKPQEKAIIIYQQTKLQNYIELVEENPDQISYNLKDNLRNQIIVSRVNKRNPHLLVRCQNLSITMNIVSTQNYKYMHILERPYIQEEDYLIAGCFTDSENTYFGHPFLMVESKNTKISDFYEKINHQFKNKKINKFFDQDSQSQITKFDAVLTYNQNNENSNISKTINITQNQNCTDTIESLGVHENFEEQEYMILKIKIYGIDLSSNIKRIQSSQN
ncbi:ubiquitin carboxy-terminal hydrolase (macronuclear) [Tetrahymena thermophila SB210]|uniref:Ubiquitin carboxy-terminal hydrolase n=1 Tax=Tetrahymena thermophila (strain SB210) TaxID=312017 RepID=Q22B80_TETTS|nr:ubiquitin carboxy-terminal hydrolase [Tetrahymena thermophila SB210]EAR82573.2 ubiquitin carboxy-terminal hydrolase [Tetrahymena thermophila SB210]|eukprot:XP_001030236.2 ubiquitin carboxy-terminal hydrolase [Tetrahymena thermophila SB210]